MSNYYSHFYSQISTTTNQTNSIGYYSNNNYCETTFLYGSGSKNISLGIPMEEIGDGSNDYGGSIKKILPTTCLIYKVRGQKPIKYTDYDQVYSNYAHGDEFVEDVSCGESASAFLTSKGRVFTSSNSANNDAFNRPTFIFTTYGDPKENINQGMIAELNLRELAKAEQQFLMDECHLHSDQHIFGVKQVCVLSNQLCIVTKSGFAWMLKNNNDISGRPEWLLLKCYKQNKENKKATTEEELARIRYVTSGLSHLVALSEDGEVFTVGQYDSYGACGCGTENIVNTVNYPTIKLVQGDSILDVYAGYYRTLIVSKLGKLYVCGWGVYNQQGIGHADNIFNFTLHEPMEKFGEKIIKVALGALHTICLCESGNCYAMGFNSYGQCGNDTDNHPLPILIPNISKRVKDIFCGWHFSILQTEDGEFYGAGANSSGELASISTTDGSSVTSFKKMSLPKVPVDNSQLVWRFYTCSFSSNVFYMGRLSISRRNQWMMNNMRNLVKISHSSLCHLSDIVILH